MTGTQMTTAHGWRDYFRMTRPAGTLPELDGLRALAIVLVLLRHAVVPFRQPGEPLLPIGGWDAATPMLNGWMGVDLFFVLSGFLISHHVLRRYGAVFDRRRTADYVLRRVLRIVPAYYTVLLLAAAGAVPYYVVAGDDLDRRVLQHLLFMQDYVGADIVVAFWSLGVEEKFYLFAPLLLVTVVRLRRPVLQYAVVAGVALLPTFFRWQLADAIGAGLDYPTYFHLFRSPFHLSFDGLALGMLCALLYRDRAHWPWLRRPGVAHACFWGGAAVTVWLLAATPIYDEIGMFDEVFLGGVLAVATSAVLLGLVLGGGPARCFRPYALFVISTLSYTLYLIHYTVIPAVMAVLAPADFAGGTPLMRFTVFLPLYLAVSFGAAALLHYVVEKPFLMLRDRRVTVGIPLRPVASVPSRARTAGA